MNLHIFELWIGNGSSLCRSNLFHDAGDEVLKQIGTLLKKHLGKSDIACRFGGEEFVLILPETTLKIALKEQKN